VGHAIDQPALPMHRLGRHFDATHDTLDPDSEQTVGAMIQRLRGNHGQEDGYPDGRRGFILDVAELAEPPLRLLLGS